MTVAGDNQVVSGSAGGVIPTGPLAGKDGFTKCANGKVHAFFAWNEYTSFGKRAKQVAAYDDRQGCGPHTVEQWTENGYEPYEPKEGL